MKAGRILILTYFTFLFMHEVCADGMSGSSSSYGTPTIEKMEPLEKATPRVLPKATPPPPVYVPPAQSVQEAVYFYPGTIVNRSGVWEGGDNLLNLPKNIGLYVNIVKPGKDPLVIDEAKLKYEATKLFTKFNINPQVLVQPGQPPLPFLQILILLYPISDRGYAASCEGRLFESVNLQRFILEPTGMAFQAITWQKSSLIITPRENLYDQLQNNIEDIIQAFGERYQAFQNIKKDLK